MAGPCASVFVSATGVENSATVAAEIVAAVATAKEGHDFWVASTQPIGGSYCGESRPFFLTIQNLDSQDSDAGTTEDELNQIERFAQFTPVAELGICAMCNHSDDHRILAELVLACARRLEGTISFRGELSSLSDDERLGMPGRTARIILSDGYHASRYIIGDVRFLEAWVAHARFRMVK